MNCDQQWCAVHRLQDLPALLRQSDGSPHQRIQRRRTERDDKPRLEQVEFRSQPPGTSLNFPCVGASMQAPLSALLEFEMLDTIGDVTERTVNPRFMQAFIQQATSRTDKRSAHLILAVTRLLTNENELSGRRAFAEHDLRRILIQIASLAFLRLPMQRSNGSAFCVVFGESRRRFLFVHGPCWHGRISLPPDVPQRGSNGYFCRGCSNSAPAEIIFPAFVASTASSNVFAALRTSPWTSVSASSSS